MRLPNWAAFSLGVALLLSAAPGRATDWTDQWWLQKASRALRGGEGLKPGEDSQALLALGREKVVEQFVADPRFADTILGFNMAFLGFRLDRIKKENGNYEDLVYELPQAVASAASVLTGGDYFDLFNIPQHHYIGPLLKPRKMESGDEKLDPAVLRRKVTRNIQADLRRILALAQSTPPERTVEICTELGNHAFKYIFSNVLNLTGGFGNTVMGDKNWYGQARDACNRPAEKYDFASGLQKIIAQNELFFTMLANLEPGLYHPGTVADIRALDLSPLKLEYEHTQFTRTVQRTLPNSSTNFDRKRAAYVLKRYFCDDLTPVNVENPDVHAGDKHASNPSCFACHYKLDPMAGFFRNYGFNFNNYSDSKNIRFDDRSRMPLADYVKNWQPGPDGAHPWNVGFIRSTQKISRNFYGNDLPDLYRFLKTAPEVRRCLVKRLFEYLVADNQLVDGDYLDYLSDEFRDNLRLGSVAAVKKAAARIVLSRAFSTPNGSTEKCLDHRPGHEDGTGGTPCRVASILNHSCVTCHGSTDQYPGLDLSHWMVFSDGTSGFPHLDDEQKMVPAKKTFEQMLARITSGDPGFRMPYKRDMPSTERQELYLWLNSRLGGGSP
ncbi:MAG: hypothetical protein HY074_10795 [Deltaproteobacteria bacterium]|nr:hypothetical protein [Deltaproteobacteria bacterium]